MILFKVLEAAVYYTYLVFHFPANAQINSMSYRKVSLSIRIIALWTKPVHNRQPLDLLKTSSNLQGYKAF